MYSCYLDIIRSIKTNVLKGVAFLKFLMKVLIIVCVTSQERLYKTFTNYNIEYTKLR